MTIESGEVCRKYGFGRSTLRYWRRQPGFPTPIEDRGNGGCTWDAAEIAAFFKVAHNRERDRQVRATYRQCGTYAETARRRGLSYKTVRRIVNA